MMRWAVVVLALLAAFTSAGVYAQSPHSDRHGAGMPELQTFTQDSDSLVAAFVERAKAATRKFQNLDAAIAAGYRLVGPDFPGMGEHWVHIRRVVQRNLDVERPAVLTYLRVGGDPILTGVAYAQPVGPGEDLPEFDVPGLWHFHSGTVDEETLLLNPPSMHHTEEDQPRLAMLHAWIWVDNPAGLFAQDNWALPFLRLGLPVPERISPQAGKSLFLLSDGVSYYGRLIEVAGSPSNAEKAAVHAVLSTYHHKVKSHFAVVQNAGAATDSDIEWLNGLWDELWNEIKRAVSSDLWSKIEMLAG